MPPLLQNSSKLQLCWIFMKVNFIKIVRKNKLRSCGTSFRSFIQATHSRGEYLLKSVSNHWHTVQCPTSPPMIEDNNWSSDGVMDGMRRKNARAALRIDTSSKEPSPGRSFRGTHLFNSLIHSSYYNTYAMAEDYVPGVRKSDREVIKRAEEKAHPHKAPENTKELLMDTKVRIIFFWLLSIFSNRHLRLS